MRLAIEIGVRLLHGHARLQARHRKQVFVIAIVRIVIARRRKRDRHPKLCLVWPVERRPHHAHHAKRLIVEHQRLANDVGIRAEALLPRPIRQHGFIAGAGLVFFRREHAPQVGPDIERIEPARRNFGAIQQFRIAVFAGVVEACRPA